MTPEVVELFWRRQICRGGPIRTLEEWAQLFPSMWRQLVSRVREVFYDCLPIRYADLGARIDLRYVPGNDLWVLKMSHLLGACAEYERCHGRPIITAIVVNESGMPGQGFWKLEAIPESLRIMGRDRDDLGRIPRDARRDEFWVAEMQRVDSFWKNPENVATFQTHVCSTTCFAGGKR